MSPVDLVAHADDNMILAQRLGEWISKAPELELEGVAPDTALRGIIEKIEAPK